MQRIRHTAANRQDDLTVIIENVHDLHNIGAIMRTCDAVGIHEIYAIYSIEDHKPIKHYTMHKSSSGSKKWVTVHFYDSVISCFAEVRKKYDFIYGTHLGEQSKELYELNLAKKVALMFGNEHRGLSDEALANIDGNFIIPQVGMVQSLNISVACAVSLYEAYRQRAIDHRYGHSFDENNAFHKEIEKLYVDRTRNPDLIYE